jgi:hypothetical protein
MNEFHLQDPISRVSKKMEVITAEGRRAGYVRRCTAARIFLNESDRPIPKEWIRRVDREVYVSKRWTDLTRRSD